MSRLGNPLVNEVLIPLAAKDYWNSQPPSGDSQFASRVSTPELAGLLPVLYPGVFPNLAAYNRRGPPGRPAGHPPDRHPDRCGPRLPELHRADPGRHAAAQRGHPADHRGRPNLGLVGGDPAGFPNGRRVFDDVATIELRAIAGATLPLVDPTFTPDAAAGAISMGLTSGPTDLTAMGTENYLPAFPYLGLPTSGFASGA